jgi:hypothetical protein
MKEPKDPLAVPCPKCGVPAGNPCKDTSRYHSERTHGGAYPHRGGCEGCRKERRCNVCGRKLESWEGCTNGRCRGCHAGACTPGGNTGPGHGYGTPLEAR